MFSVVVMSCQTVSIVLVEFVESIDVPSIQVELFLHFRFVQVCMKFIYKQASHIDNILCYETTEIQKYSVM